MEPPTTDTILREAVIAYDTALTNNIVNMPSSVSVYNGSGALVAQAKYGYDQTSVTATTNTPQHTTISGSRGNVTTVQYLTSGSTYLTQTYSYYDTGNANIFTDVNSGQTTYAYGSSTSCGNSSATGVTEAVTTLTQSYAWNCTGGVRTSTTDENSQIWSKAFADPNYWRPTSTTDPASATTSLCYWPDGPSTCTTHSGLFGTEGTLNFNGATSTVDALTALDSQGRTHVTQRRQTQGGSNYDSVETDYNAEGLPSMVTVPYTGTAGELDPNDPNSVGTKTTYDALNRPLTITDGGGGTTTYNYTQAPGSSPVGFDVLVTVSGGSSFSRQFEYDGLGRLTSVCEVTSASGSGTCAQSVRPTGYWTKYTYDVLNDLLTVTQNAQGSTTQTRTYAYDGLGRMTSEKNPETNQTAYSYTFDTDTTCGTHDGDLVKRIDPQLTVTCYAYDALHRLTSVTYPSGGYYNVTPAKYYVYDLATVDGAMMSNAKSRLAEAYTGASKTTDLGFSYSTRGEVAGVYQSSTHSGGYYHLAATYWAPQGLLDTLNPNMTGAPTWTYGPDGEGRVNTVSASSGTNPVTATSYNGFSEPLGVTFGSADSDAFTYDPNTGRMTQYKATINGSAVYGNLTWNANWTLGILATTDPFNSGNNGKSCGYTYDGLARLSTVNCGAGNWAQTFSYVDNATSGAAAFGNISKTVPTGYTGQTFAATYSDTTNRLATVGTTSVTYDNNGNILSDGFHSYAWDGEGKLATLDSNPESYDALGRRVEQSASGVYTELVYGPGGNKMALMNGQTVTKVFAPLSGGATAVYTSSGLSYYRHPDWLGSSRLASTPSRTVYYDGAYAPFGEPYAETGATDRNFTGQDQDLTPGSTGNLYDFPYREYHPTQGRFVSPDPAGINAVDPTNPQSWNRYAYALNNPLANIDPSGLLYCAPASPDGSDGADDPDCVSDGEYNANPDMYPGWLQVILMQSVTVTDTQDYVDYEWSLMGFAPAPGMQVLSMVWQRIGFIAQPACSGGAFVFAGAHGSVPILNGQATLQGELGGVAQYDSAKGWETGVLVEVGTPLATVGGEFGYNWTQGQTYLEAFMFSGAVPSALPNATVPNPFSNEKTGLDLGELGAGLLITPESEVGGYVQLGPFAAGAYAKPSFLGKNSCGNH